MHIFRDVVLASTLILGVAVADSPVNNPDTTEPIPSPFVVPPSQYWDGVDGEWSSFALRVGEPAQNVRVLASTNSPQTMVVVPDGCTTKAMKPVPADCANSRGGTFNLNASKTWDNQGFFGINDNGVGWEANLGYTQNTDYGLDTVGLGYASEGPTLENQTVGGFGTASPFYLGTFGLGTEPVNYTTIGNFSSPSFFTSLRSQKIIPSLSWSYTAGAKYRLKAGQYAQLIFGGYDASRFTSNSASFTLAPDINRDIVVAIQSITYSGTTQADLLATPIYAFIESTDPNFWLPAAACQQFEKAFGISVDKATGLYLINATHYSDLKSAGAEVTFSLANSLSGGDTVNIVLPFNAFALSATYPFTPADTYYFPLRRAANDSQITLGRAFLQEAYLTVDYERGNFSVSQCLWEDGAATEVMPIISSSYPTNSSSTESTPAPTKATTDSKTHLGSGTIAAIVIATLVVIGGAVGLSFFLLRRRKRPVSKVPTEDVNLTVDDKDKDGIPLQSPAVPAPVYKKYGTEHSFYGQGIPRIELPTSSEEIYQLPDHNNQDGDYFTAAREMRAAATPEVEGNHVYELQGSQPRPTEMDDEESRSTLSPKLSPDLRTPRTPDTTRGWPRTPDTTRGSPRIPSPMSPLSPLSDFSDYGR